MKERRHFRVVDDQGEVHEDCPGCQDLEDTLVQAEVQLRMANARITRMQRDDEERARKNALWAEAEALHTWWRLACWHPGTKFTAEDFKHVAPRLKERGPIGVLKAIAGAAYDPGSSTMKNGRPMVYDDWELVNRSKAKADNFALRAPGREGSHDWKRWLIQRIESNLKGGTK